MSENKLISAHSGVARYRFPDEEPPPLGCKLLLYTSGGTAVIGLWSDDSNFVAWSPLPPKPVREMKLMDQHDTTLRVGVQWTEEPDHGV